MVLETSPVNSRNAARAIGGPSPRVVDLVELGEPTERRKDLRDKPQRTPLRIDAPRATDSPHVISKEFERPTETLPLTPSSGGGTQAAPSAIPLQHGGGCTARHPLTANTVNTTARPVIETKIRNVGNSAVMTLTAEMLALLDAKPGDSPFVVRADDGQDRGP